MCGILGLVHGSSFINDLPSSQYEEAIATLGHRGPDSSGQYHDSSAWIAHTRLSILDLSPAASQPMISADGRFVITYNGEVYNFRDLASEYDLRNLRSGSDTEVVLELFLAQGPQALAKLNGMFAFAIYDSVERKLWLVRDRFGIKPLYYQMHAGCVTFASEVKGIKALTTGESNCDVAGLHEWLYYGNSLGEHTLYSDIKQLLPGHYLELDVSSFDFDVRSYWSLEKQVVRSARDRENCGCVVNDTRNLLENAVERQLVSDVPVGVFLSGGVDSSAIVAFASRHYQNRLATYSVGFDFMRGGGELPRAKRVAEKFGTDHHELFVKGGAVGDLIEKMVWHHDMPFADAANIPLYLMAREISGSAKVVLQGDGGDELFGGYRRYSTLKHYALLRCLARSFQCIDRASPRSAGHFRLKRYANALCADDLATTMALLLTVESRFSKPASVFSQAMCNAIETSDPFARFREAQSMFIDQDIGNQMSFVDLMIVLPDRFLEKVDRSTMAASLEVRVPFLDNDLVNFVVGIPSNGKIPRGKKKWLLKKALRDVVPEEVLNGPKSGLTVPYGKWLQTALKPLFFDHLATFARHCPDVLDVSHIEEVFRRTNSGSQDGSYMLWKLLNLMVWANKSKVNFLPGTSV